ncbi:MAG: S9 family peptidase [Bacteroidales bacterium]
MRTLYTLFLFVIMAMPSRAENKKLTLHDLIPGGKTYQSFVPQNIKQLQWFGDQLTFVKGDTLYVSSPDQPQKKTSLLTKDDFSQFGMKHLPYIVFPYGKESVIEFSKGDTIYVYDFKNKEIINVFNIKGKNNRDLNRVAKNIAYTVDNNLYISDSNNISKAITNDSNKGIVNGQAVHQREFGIEKGTFWSPSGKKLAFYRMDETMVPNYPLLHAATKPAQINNIKYPMAGTKSHHVTVGIYSTESNDTVFLKTGLPKEKYLTNISWSPDESIVYISELNRGQDSLELRAYNAKNGKLISTLIKETHDKWVEPENPILFLPKNHKEFIWQSERDGYNHLYLYNTDGQLIRPLTSGEWLVLSVLGFDEKGENVFIQSTEESPIEKHTYKVNLKTGKRTRLTQGKGMHQVSLSDNKRYLIDQYSNLNTPREIAVIDTKNGKRYSVLSAKNPFTAYNMPEIALGTIKAADGKTDLHYRLIKPVDFDSTKKYPTVVYVYGGPHAQLVTDSWLGGARGWDIYMAQLGYVVFTVDNRGSANRGLEFENVIHRQLGTEEMKDQVKGIEYLSTLPYVDTDRIGVHGWSFGGFMTTNLLLTYPEIFKVGVAGGAVMDWGLYEIMYGERYMDSPQENPEGYDKSNLTKRAGDLKGDLLIIHDDEDNVVLMQHALRFLDASVKAGTYPDLFIYPGHEHNVRGIDRVHLHEVITRYFEKNLK